MDVFGAWTPRIVAVLTAGLLLVLSACGGGRDEPSSSASRGETSPPAAGPRLSIVMTDFALDVAKPNLAAGTYTLVAEQQGGVDHALSISGPGIDAESTDVLAPGDDPDELTVQLQPGTYELWCPVGSHRAQGMEATLTVG